MRNASFTSRGFLWLLTYLSSFPRSNMVGLVGIEWGYGKEREAPEGAAEVGTLGSTYRLLGS